MTFTKHNAEAMGRQGGRSTFARHGRDHMAEIGRRGFRATCNRHYGGDRRAMLNELIRRGLRAMDPCPWSDHWRNYTAFPDRPAPTGGPGPCKSRS
jgi:general stress protein YciG